MPDADDFDVEYFRNLLKGNPPQDGPAALAAPAPPVAKKGGRQAPKAPAAVQKRTSAAGQKKNKNR
jgi:hypothetical protein